MCKIVCDFVKDVFMCITEVWLVPLLLLAYTTAAAAAATVYEDIWLLKMM